MALRRPAPPAARDEPERRAEPVAPKVLRDYALVADGVRGALVGSEGEVAWLCFPTWSDPAVIAGLLGAGGVYQVRPRGRAVAEGRYDDGTLVWTSRWVTEDGVLDVRNVLALPGDPRRAVLLRRVTAEGPPCVVDVALELASDYGRSAGGSWARTDEGSFVLDGPGWSARLSGLPEAVAQRSPAGGTQLAATLEVRPGEPRDLVVELACGQLSAFPPVDVATTWGTTERAWAGAVPACEDTIAPRDARRACAVLRAMTTSEGATIAAATTSLPEQDRADRNYDYRYAWVRDTCYVGQAGAAIVGGEAIMDDAVRWVSARLLDDGPAT
ncbi:MAG TPA: trehalase-like domain-containing protein, partial [Acidimicrobiales bacterium]|nr:trehalase-like domain-containing protein [Acidimicrobiales bacterium]